jgi:hypothetical protein
MKRWRRLVLVLVTLAGFPPFVPAAPADAKPIDRVAQIRSRLLEADRSAPAPDGLASGRLGDVPRHLAQYWRNWPNYWANWPNWPNWPNWGNWRNW